MEVFDNISRAFKKLVEKNVKETKEEDKKAKHENFLKNKLIGGDWFLLWSKKRFGRSSADRTFLCAAPGLHLLRWGPDIAAALQEKFSINVSELKSVHRGAEAYALERKVKLKLDDVSDQDLQATLLTLVCKDGSLLDLNANSQEARDIWGEALNFLIESRISTPFNVEHKAHVDKDLIWSGKNIPDLFEVKELLGTGSFGQVYRVLYKESSSEMALKTIYVFDEVTAKEIENEVEILKQCRHPNIISYFGCWGPDQNNAMWILMELCPLGSLSDCMKLTKSVFSEEQIAFICLTLIGALIVLHQVHKIIHLDIKAGNILLMEGGIIKLTDFGISRPIAQHDQAENRVGSPLWMPPEAIDGLPPSFKSDVWSLAITAMELAEGVPPRSDAGKVADLLKMVKAEPPPTLKQPRKWSSKFKEFLSYCLVKDPKQRPSMNDLLKHPFIASAKNDPVILKSPVENYKSAKQKESKKSLELSIPTPGGSVPSTPRSYPPGSATVTPAGGDKKFFKTKIKELKRKTEKMKIVALGDKQSGRTLLLSTISTNGIAPASIPTVFDNYFTTHAILDYDMQIGLYDICGIDSGDSEEQRKILFKDPPTDCFLLIFSLLDQQQFNNATKEWLAEIRRYNPTVPIVLIGHHEALQPSGSVVALSKGGKRAVTFEKAESFAKREKIFRYLECSSLTGDAIHQILDTSCESFLAKKGLWKEPIEAEAKLLDKLVISEPPSPQPLDHARTPSRSASPSRNPSSKPRGKLEFFFSSTPKQG